MKARIGVIDYEAGNMASVMNALEQLGIDAFVSSDEAELKEASGVILPGVGAAPGAMESLSKRNVVKFLRTTEKPLLGICLGMQLLFEFSEEGMTETLKVIPGRVLRFDSSKQKVPQMGWNFVNAANTANTVTNDPLFEGINKGAYFYFAHSFYVPLSKDLTLATASASFSFSAAVRKGNLWGVQFHPEKSGPTGLSLLKNFEAICKSSHR
jgi:glutamine amidotransferase